jgi:hypothetical protein
MIMIIFCNKLHHSSSAKSHCTNIKNGPSISKPWKVFQRNNVRKGSPQWFTLACSFEYPGQKNMNTKQSCRVESNTCTQMVHNTLVALLKMQCHQPACTFFYICINNTTRSYIVSHNVGTKPFSWIQCCDFFNFMQETSDGQNASDSFNFKHTVHEDKIFMTPTTQGRQVSGHKAYDFF